MGLLNDLESITSFEQAQRHLKTIGVNHRLRVYVSWSKIKDLEYIKWKEI